MRKKTFEQILDLRLSSMCGHVVSVLTLNCLAELFSKGEKNCVLIVLTNYITVTVFFIVVLTTL